MQKCYFQRINWFRASAATATIAIATPKGPFDDAVVSWCCCRSCKLDLAIESVHYYTLSFGSFLLLLSFNLWLCLCHWELTEAQMTSALEVVSYASFVCRIIVFSFLFFRESRLPGSLFQYYFDRKRSDRISYFVFRDGQPKWIARNDRKYYGILC